MIWQGDTLRNIQGNVLYRPFSWLRLCYPWFVDPVSNFSSTRVEAAGSYLITLLRVRVVFNWSNYFPASTFTYLALRMPKHSSLHKCTRHNSRSRIGTIK